MAQSPTALNHRSSNSPTGRGMNTNTLISQLKYKQALAVAEGKAMSQTFMANESQKGGFHRSHSHNLTQRSI